MALKVRRGISLALCAFVIYAGLRVGEGVAGVIVSIMFAVALYAALENG